MNGNVKEKDNRTAIRKKWNNITDQNKIQNNAQEGNIDRKNVECYIESKDMNSNKEYNTA